jgi:chorismate-pyruvate lyase
MIPRDPPQAAVLGAAFKPTVIDRQTMSAGPQLLDLLALFPPLDPIRAYEYIAAEDVPEPYRKLLVHEHHMTVTVEAHHGSLVDVRILERKHEGDLYARKILLTLQSTGKVVQFGIVRIRFEHCSALVREAIVAGNTPLGRVLIEHNVLRRIEPTAYLRILPGAAMMEWFGLARPTPTYGRLALIHCDGQPAVELLEIVAPE